jgi:DNA-binding CsgD family transcriptional regulator
LRCLCTIPLQERDGNHYVAHVIPLFSGARRSIGDIYAAVATVILQQASLDISSMAQAAMARVFNLTPSEIRVMLGIVDIGGVPVTARALGTSQPTVNKHLQHIYAKTGMRRRAELVKLAASFSNVPIR